MAIYKNKDIETNIKATHVNLGNIGAQFYTEDENSASIRMYIKHNDEPVNLLIAGLTPILSLSMQDGSYFDNEPVDIVLAEQGLIQYKIRDNVIKHVGKVKATLELKGESQSIYACEFSFTILSSGKDEQIAKEINVNLVEDTVKKIMSEDLTELLNTDFKSELTTDLQTYLKDNNDIFKGKDGISPTLPNMDNWQKVSLTDSAGNILFLYETDFNTIDTLNLTTGFYYVSNGINLPKNVTNYGYLVYKRLNNNMQRIEYSPFNSSETYIKNKIDTWGEWEIAVMSNDDVKKMKNTIETQSQQIAMLQELIMNREV